LVLCNLGHVFYLSSRPSRPLIAHPGLAQGRSRSYISMASSSCCHIVIVIPPSGWDDGKRGNERREKTERENRHSLFLRPPRPPGVCASKRPRSTHARVSSDDSHGRPALQTSGEAEHALALLPHAPNRTRARSFLQPRPRLLSLHATGHRSPTTTTTATNHHPPTARRLRRLADEHHDKP